MLDLKYIRENLDEVKANTKNRGLDVNFKVFQELDQARRDLIAEIQTKREQLNKKSKTKPSEAEIAKLKQVSEDIGQQEDHLKAIESDLHGLMLQIPNLTHPEVKIASSDDDNVIIESDKPKEFAFEPLDHVTLAERLNLLDLERGAKVAGAKFYYLKNDLARLELALINYTLDILAKAGWQIMSTPDLAKTDLIENLGFNPRGESTQVYNLEDSDLSLIGTAEITLGGYHSDEILEEGVLPIKYAAHSHCFRTEAGSYSKYSKGIFRVHQFVKVEMFAFSLPEKSASLLSEMLALQQSIWQGLAVPLRVVDHSTADLGNPSYRTYDLEAWLPGKVAKTGTPGDWAEMTSVSNCTDYQARGINCRYKTADGKEFVHTLNGTGVATTRALIAILENHQTKDGKINIPKALQPYLGGQKTIS